MRFIATAKPPPAPVTLPGKQSIGQVSLKKYHPPRSLNSEKRIINTLLILLLHKASFDSIKKNVLSFLCQDTQNDMKRPEKRRTCAYVSVCITQPMNLKL